MGNSFPAALKHYQDGRFAEALAMIGPLAAAQASPPLQVLLVAGQCAAKLELFSHAADYFTRAAALKTEKEPMLRALAAEFLAKSTANGDALAAARTAVKTLPFDPHTFRTFRSLLQETMSLDEKAIEDQALFDRLKRGDERVMAAEQHLDHISWCDDESINRLMRYGRANIAFSAEMQSARRRRPHRYGSRIRIGYLSNDVCDQHPTMQLFQGVLMSHDPARFEVTLFCYTDQTMLAEDRGMRKRYPHIVPIGHLDDDQAAALIRSHEIDVLVDLKGSTRGARMALVNKGLAPVQVAYLGFPGSVVGIDCDYVIGDRYVLPESSKPHYHEKFCLMPDSYQANDNLFRSIPSGLPRGLGLPPGRLVFASFNAARKITAKTATLWAEILTQVNDSVLWMMLKNPRARENFTLFMERQGIAADRLIYTSYVASEAHLARLPAADIALDSFPYNGHTTTSDALWAGVPVTTFYGRHFASRVSASLLHAAGLGRLVAEDEAGYVDLTVRLARDGEWRREIRNHLVSGRSTLPLFDTARFVRHLELAFQMMVDRARAGLDPEHFAVPAISTTRPDLRPVAAATVARSA